MYVGYDPRADQLLIKGLKAKRRNYMPFARETFKSVLIKLCKHGDIDGAFAYVKTRFEQLLHIADKTWKQANLPLEDFVTTANIKHISEYKGRPPLGYCVNQKLGDRCLGPGERIQIFHYYDKRDEKHNGSKNKNEKWLPGKTKDTAIPLLLAYEDANISIDVYKVLVQHEEELRQYFRAVSVHHMRQFDVLYMDTLNEIKKIRGCNHKSLKYYAVQFLNM
jgi:hypothetical protein